MIIKRDIVVAQGDMSESFCIMLRGNTQRLKTSWVIFNNVVDAKYSTRENFFYFKTDACIMLLMCWNIWALIIQESFKALVA